MNLVLEIVNTPSHSIFEQTMHFTQMGGKIGRNKQMDWVLHDPSKHISNFHAEISFENNQYFLTDQSSNGTFFKHPHKRLTKNVAVPLTQTTVIVIGNYEIAVKLVGDTFMQEDNASQKPIQTKDFGIPDQFFMGNQTEKAFDIINQKEQNNDILSLIDSDQVPIEDNILPDLDNIIGDFSEDSGNSIDNSLNIHIEDPFVQPVEMEPQAAEMPKSQVIPPKETTHYDDKLFSLLSMKLGLDTQNMTAENKEAFIIEIADLVQTTLEQSQTSLQSLKAIQSQLGVQKENSFNPLGKGTSNKEIFSNMHAYPKPLHTYIKNMFHELNTHNVALYTATNTISLDVANTFSPQRLYFSFEQENLLNKTFTNKKALAWDAYYAKFKYLDLIKNKEDVDMSDLQKEYQSTLKTLNLGYNT